MKTPKLILIALAFCVCSMANAQTLKKVEDTAKAKTEQLAESLDLTENQEVMIYRQIYTLERQTLSYEAADKKTPEIKASYNAYKENFESEVMKQLTDEQRESFKKSWDKINK